MGVQYYCDNERRREAVSEHATLNGIDYLEVLDLQAPTDSPRQQTLLLRLIKSMAAAPATENVRIDGGVRVTPIAIVWVIRAADAADAFTAGLIIESERDYLLGLSEPDHVLVVRTDSSGDYSTYSLSLVVSQTNPQPLPDMDPILSTVSFSFKVECPSEFDCPDEAPCPPEIEEEPTLDYLAKDYASFRQLILDRLAVIMPDWQERNPADLGIVLVELLAYAGDYLSYYQDAAATESYLGTARRRISMRRHARLLDYAMHDGCNARAWVSFQVNRGGDGALLPQLNAVSGMPTLLLTHVPEAAVIREERLQELLSVYQPEVFELLHDVRLYQAHNEISFYTWGDEECCLPIGATRATLLDNAAQRLRLRPGDVLVFEERRDPGTGLSADADPAHRHAVRLTHVYPEAVVDVNGLRTPGPVVEDPLYEEPIVEIAWDAMDALPFPLCISAIARGALIDEISVAVGNVGLVDHGRTIANEAVAAPSGHLRFRPLLNEAGMTFKTPYRVGVDDATSAAITMQQDPRKALPAVRLSGDGEIWLPQRDLLNSDRFASEFVVEMTREERAQLRFGDGIYGRAPVDTGLDAYYRIGNGTDGNVGAEAVAHVVTGTGGIQLVRNPLPAWGGTDAESREEVRQYAPQAFRTQERAVTEADYAEVAERHPEVQRAVATRRWSGSWYTMFLTVDRSGGRPVDTEFEDELCLHLERFRLTGQDVEIDGPRLVPLEIVLTVCVKPGYFAADVKKALFETFANYDLADGRRGFFHPDNYSFGQPVYLSQVIATAMDVPGVAWVDVDDSEDKPNRFQRWGRSADGEIADGQISMDRLEIAQLDNDPNQRENGKIDFLMEGGS